MRMGRPAGMKQLLASERAAGIVRLAVELPGSRMWSVRSSEDFELCCISSNILGSSPLCGKAPISDGFSSLVSHDQSYRFMSFLPLLNSCIQVSVLEMDGQFDNLQELIYVESHLSNIG
ncbi:unnamed protein product, partial [Phaeothamnion confervicola]